MSTHAMIADITNGTVRAIYLHNDGYPEHTGCVLEQAYTTAEAVDRLIKIGDLSVLKANLEPDPTKPHNFDNPQANVTVAYHRDRGEDLHIMTFPLKDICDSEETLINRLSDGSYVYVFKNNKWYWAAYGHKRLKQLSSKLKSMK